MSTFNVNEFISKLTGLDQRQADDAIYAQIFDEYSSGAMDKVAQARALEASGGNQEKIKSEYIRFRFIRIKDEIAAIQKAQRAEKAAYDAKRRAKEKRQREEHEALRNEIRNRRGKFDDAAFGDEYDQQQYNLEKYKKDPDAVMIWTILLGSLALIICIMFAVQA